MANHSMQRAHTTVDGRVRGAVPSGRGRLRSVERSLEAEFDEFYRREYPNLARLAYAMCGNGAESEEVAQEAMTRAFANWHRVRRLERADAWCRRVLLNEVIGRSRRVAVDRRRRFLVAPAEARPDHAVVSSTSEALWGEVRKLPRRQAQAVALFYGLDMPVGEIAGVLGLDEATVRGHLHSARRSLASRLGPEWRGGDR